MENYTKNGKTLPYEIIYKKNKNTYFRVHGDLIRITTNRYTKKEKIKEFLDQRFDSFYEKLYHQSRIEKEDEITLWGITYPMVLVNGRFSYQIQKGLIIINTLWNDLKKIKEHIYKFELTKEIEHLYPLIKDTVQKKGLSPLPIKLKYLKSKFGSYHRRNKEITLNTFLARLDPIYLLYVLYHEYAHALVFNHSKDFYHLLGEFMPNHKLYQKDLKKIAII